MNTTGDNEPDWLDDAMPLDQLVALLRQVQSMPDKQWLLLTKRPERFFDRMRSAWVWEGNQENPSRRLLDWIYGWAKQGFAPANVRTGVVNEAGEITLIDILGRAAFKSDASSASKTSGSAATEPRNP